MRIIDVIEKKRDGYPLSEEEISFFVKGYSEGKIEDYQASALMMAIYFRGMDEKETSFLTKAMMESGDVLDLSCIPGVKVDKHSTGGVGDKTSLALGPLVAANGAKLAKMSGRALGHTGGTLDKLESIPGLKVEIDEDRFIKQVQEIGIAIIGQSKNLDPADKKMYALRDVTGTVPSIPLIASSIMSKKLASGSDAILLDVKYGSGAFMKTIEEARILAKEMVKIGKHLGRDVRAIITDMDEPLGLAVGNSLEVIEAINTLKGKGPSDFVELVVSAGGIMLTQAKISRNYEEGEALIKKAIEDGSGLKKLEQLISYQGGDPSYIDPSRFDKASNSLPVYADKSGYIERIDSLSIGKLSCLLGAGREKKTDPIDYSAGIILNKKVGDLVKEGDLLLTLYSEKKIEGEFKEKALDAYSYSVSPIKGKKIVYEVID